MKKQGIIITRTPFRISFLGGGTDVPVYFNEKAGAVLGTAINKYTYVTINSLERLLENKIRVSYSKMENVEKISDLEDDFMRTILTSGNNVNEDDFLDIHTYADLPSGTGIGSSSSFTVGMLNALHSINGKYITPEKLAIEAIRIERDELKQKGGWQDQIFASVGGTNFIEFSDNDFRVSKLVLSKEKRNALESSCMLFYTNITRASAEIQKEVFDKNKIIENSKYLERLYDLAVEGRDLLYESYETYDMLQRFGEIMGEGWKLKSSLSGKITNPLIEEIYKTAINAGAWGGKICGAGSGGFILFLVPEDRRELVSESLARLKQIDIKFEQYGSQVIFAD